MTKEKVKIEKLSKANLGRKHTDETRRNMSESAKGKIISEETKKKISKAGIGRKHSNESKSKISKAHKGRVYSDEQRLRNSISQGSTPFKVISPTGIIYEGINRKEFARNHNLTYRLLLKVIKGEKVHHKGWKLF